MAPLGFIALVLIASNLCSISGNVLPCSSIPDDLFSVPDISWAGCVSYSSRGVGGLYADQFGYLQNGPRQYSETLGPAYYFNGSLPYFSQYRSAPVIAGTYSTVVGSQSCPQLFPTQFSVAIDPVDNKIFIQSVIPAGSFANSSLISATLIPSTVWVLLLTVDTCSVPFICVSGPCLSQLDGIYVAMPQLGVSTQVNVSTVLNAEAGLATVMVQTRSSVETFSLVLSGFPPVWTTVNGQFNFTSNGITLNSQPLYCYSGGCLEDSPQSSFVRQIGGVYDTPLGSLQVTTVADSAGVVLSGAMNDSCVLVTIYHGGIMLQFMLQCVNRSQPAFPFPGNVVLSAVSWAQTYPCVHNCQAVAPSLAGVYNCRLQTNSARLNVTVQQTGFQLRLNNGTVTQTGLYYAGFAVFQQGVTLPFNSIAFPYLLGGGLNMPYCQCLSGDCLSLQPSSPVAVPLLTGLYGRGLCQSSSACASSFDVTYAMVLQNVSIAARPQAFPFVLSAASEPSLLPPALSIPPFETATGVLYVPTTAPADGLYQITLTWSLTGDCNGLAFVGSTAQPAYLVLFCGDLLMQFSCLGGSCGGIRSPLPYIFPFQLTDTPTSAPLLPSGENCVSTDGGGSCNSVQSQIEVVSVQFSSASQATVAGGLAQVQVTPATSFFQTAFPFPLAQGIGYCMGAMIWSNSPPSTSLNCYTTGFVGPSELSVDLYSNEALCGPGTQTYTSISSEDICISCPVGSYSTVPSSTSCSLCAAGSYGVGTGQTSSLSACISCAPGSYNGVAGVSQCTLCNATTFNEDSGQTSAASCNPCPAGTYNPLPGEGSEKDCLACPFGQYNNRTGQFRCQACDTSVLLCPPGTATPMLTLALMQQQSTNVSGLSTESYSDRVNSVTVSGTHRLILIVALAGAGLLVLVLLSFVVVARAQSGGWLAGKLQSTDLLFKLKHKTEMGRPLVAMQTSMGGVFTILVALAVALLLCGLTIGQVAYNISSSDVVSIGNTPLPPGITKFAGDFNGTIEMFGVSPSMCSQAVISQVGFSFGSNFVQVAAPGQVAGVCVGTWQCTSCTVVQQTWSITMQVNNFIASASAIRMSLTVNSMLPHYKNGMFASSILPTFTQVFRGSSATVFLGILAPTIYQQNSRSVASGYRVYPQDTELGSLYNSSTFSLAPTAAVQATLQLQLLVGFTIVNDAELTSLVQYFTQISSLSQALLGGAAVALLVWESATGCGMIRRVRRRFAQQDNKPAAELDVPLLHLPDKHASVADIRDYHQLSLQVSHLDGQMQLSMETMLRRIASIESRIDSQ
eukprot:TRINITY_DN12749_c0_g1_i1.p1 TRINITY_DN12749_c0_g1~~TRINITY_DN12749_c0_g1_i1.p1  ORF type:complete len:1296 (+),score=235.60 TRINITY_DN12749_c0_g1_i1:114-4001(+)